MPEPVQQVLLRNRRRSFTALEQWLVFSYSDAGPIDWEDEVGDLLKIAEQIPEAWVEADRPLPPLEQSVLRASGLLARWTGRGRAASNDPELPSNAT